MPPDAVGWDWIGIHLDDGGGALTAFRLRRARTASALWAGGSWRTRGGEAARLRRRRGALHAAALVDEPGHRGALPGAVAVETPAGSHELRARMDAGNSTAEPRPAHCTGRACPTCSTRRAGASARLLELTGYARRCAWLIRQRAHAVAAVGLGRAQGRVGLGIMQSSDGISGAQRRNTDADRRAGLEPCHGRRRSCTRPDALGDIQRAQRIGLLGGTRSAPRPRARDEVGLAQRGTGGAAMARRRRRGCRGRR